jgi:hypothetical protein
MHPFLQDSSEITLSSDTRSRFFRWPDDHIDIVLQSSQSARSGHCRPAPKLAGGSIATAA